MPSSLIAFLLMAAAPQATPQATPPVPQIAVGDRLARFDKLKPGVRTYLRYRNIRGILRPIDIWRREVRFDTREGKRRLHIVQSWTGAAAAPHNLDLDSWFEEGTFAPISHERRLIRAEETRNEGFLFSPGKVEALPGTPDNSRADFIQDAAQPVFNFETDMEMLQTLPLGEGYAARLRFYHPGGPAPADYVFRVIGSSRLPTTTGMEDCWLVTLAAAESPTGLPSRFFVAKKDQQILRVEQPQVDGSMIVKVLLAGAPA